MCHFSMAVGCLTRVDQALTDARPYVELEIWAGSKTRGQKPTHGALLVCVGALEGLEKKMDTAKKIHP